MTALTTRRHAAPPNDHRRAPAGPVASRLVLAVLATWRVTHLLAAEDGPSDAVVRLRARVRRPWLGELMDCFYCLSVWVAAPLSLVAGRRRRDLPVTWLALSGAACLLERATAPAQPADVGAELRDPSRVLALQPDFELQPGGLA